MIDLRPVGYVIGLLVAALGVAMVVPLALELSDGSPYWAAFLESAVICVVTGGLIALASINGLSPSLSVQQIFLLTTGVWVALPVFGALPLMLAPPHASITDAFFESVSGLTTTGSTAFTNLQELPRGVLLWRSMLQWFGGIGVIVVAMIFLPQLRIGGMQIFRSEAFDTMGKILPRAAEIARQIVWIYLGLTFLCFFGYLFAGMSSFNAINHALTTIATGGFSTTDASFAAFRGAPEYVASVFMILASLPFVRYVQFAAGTARPLFRDPQIRAFVAIVIGVALLLDLVESEALSLQGGNVFRETLFNVTSIMSGTGYASTNYQLWGPFAMVVFFFIGLVGGCAGSTCCSIKVFRYQILFSAVRAQIRRIHSPHGLFQPRFDGRPVDEDVLNSVMAFFVLFVVSLGVLAVLLALTGLDTVTALSGAATAIGNIGPGLGEVIGPTGSFEPINSAAKWLLIAGMLVGRLELLAVYVLFTAAFWRG
jgi:trk system potassium uptake protein TrkH